MLFVVMVGAVCAEFVFAQAESPIQEESSPWMQWAFVMVAAALVIAISTKNAKRTHQG